jgi:hypothetical protein
MNQSQMKYARQRAEEIKTKKLQDISTKYTTPAVTLTTEQRIKALKAGEYTIDNKQINSGYYWYNAIKFNGDTPRTIDTEKAAKEHAKVKETFTKLMDELILGDNEEALRLLVAFEAL